MFLATGEWWVSNLLFGAAFIVAGAGVVGIGWWVLRGDRLNRMTAGEVDETGAPRQAEH